MLAAACPVETARLFFDHTIFGPLESAEEDINYS